MFGQNHLVEVLSNAQKTLGISTEEFAPLVLESLGQMLWQQARADVKEMEEKAKAEAKALHEQAQHAESNAKELEEKARALEQKARENAKAMEEKARALEQKARENAKAME